MPAQLARPNVYTIEGRYGAPAFKTPGLEDECFAEALEVKTLPPHIATRSIKVCE